MKKSLALTITGLFLLSACGTKAELGEYVTVDHIIDPLTFVTTDGYKIRLIGVRSPLITEPVQCYGAEAMQAAESLIGREVRLEVEPLFTIAQDGALPRYVFLTLDPKPEKPTVPAGTGAVEAMEKEEAPMLEPVTGTGDNMMMPPAGTGAIQTADAKKEEEKDREIMVNERALEMGTAFPLVSQEMIYGERMLSAARYASATQKGLWGACEVTPQQTPQGNILNTQTLTECVIKGKVLKNGDKIYRTPDCPAYRETIVSGTDGGQWFCAPDIAEDAGFVRASDCK